jgi:cysteine-rich repeat protein
VAVIVSAFLLSAIPASAHQNPANCTGNNLNLDLLKNKTQIVSGEIVHYTVNVRNDAAGACDIDNSTVTFTCPAADGTSTGPATTCTSGATFLAGFPPTTVCQVDCTVTVNPGVASAQAKAEVHGTLHDNPANDFDTADVLKFISVQVIFCGDGIINVAGETCDPPGSPAGNNGNTCRNNCTVCGDGHVDAGETCDDGNGVNGDGCENNCTPTPRCGDGIVGNTPGETCDPPGSAAGNNGNTCRDNCTVCGDGHVDAGETCDDGNGVNGDGCENNCTPSPRCGDGIVGNTPGETCDPPGSTAGAIGNICRDNCTVCGDGHVDAGETCDDGNANNSDTCQNDCTPPQPCSVVITKTVAPDDGSGGGTACDGQADGPFVESVTVGETSCVVYQICVQNTGGQTLDTSGVTVSDPVLGSVNVNFGTIEPGQTVCKQAPGAMTAPTCTGGAGASCICTQVEGVNTATITSAICEGTGQNACAQPGSDCSDTANVACLGAGSCRMTGGHNFDVVDAEFDENGKVYTTGGQIGAPNETGCCDLPPKGKCVAGLCTGGLNGGAACTSNDQCPNDPGRNSHCPWGDWEHNHHSGPDDSNSVKGGSFAFHSGTAAAPNEAFIKSVLCADPGWCVQARPAPFKQIFWEGTGVFHNDKDPKNKDLPLPRFEACGANQPVPYSKNGGTLHYYKAHVSDFGEPAGIHQKPVGACQKDESCLSREPNQSVEISDCALGDVCLIDAVNADKETALHPLCLAQTCSECPDEYEIEIHCTVDPASPVAYRVSHEIREGNFQLHPPVGDSCNPSCGDGVCDPGVTGTAETCESCAADCCP